MSTAAPAVALAECIPAPDLARAARLALDALIAILEDAKASVTNRRLAAAAILRLAIPTPKRAEPPRRAATSKRAATVGQRVPHAAPTLAAPDPSPPSSHATPAATLLAHAGAPTPRATMHARTAPGSSPLHPRVSPSPWRAPPPLAPEPRT